MRGMIVDSAQARLVQALRAHEDAARAEWEKAYQKSAWAHWGVSLPEMDAAIKETLGDLFALHSCRSAPSVCRAAGPNTRHKRVL
jgi:hypothetical protein